MLQIQEQSDIYNYLHQMGILINQPDTNQSAKDKT